MKLPVLSALLVCFSGVAFAQSEPKIVAYFDFAWKRTPKEKADFYRTVEPVGDQYRVKDYYMSGQLQMEALCTAYEPKLLWKGNTVLYHKNGAVSEEGMFENEERSGLHTYWYEDGKKEKEVIHAGKKALMTQYWSPAGEPLLVNGTGTIRESEKDHVGYIEVEDSIIVASYDMPNGIDTVYSHVQQLPEYKGGTKAMMKAIRSRMKYPKEARRRGTEGRVYVKFIVDKKGKVREAAILYGISPDCDAESVRVVSTLNRWNPGLVRGKPVAVRYILPISFALK